MTSHPLETVALALVAEGKRILAADETVPPRTKRFDTRPVDRAEPSVSPAGGRFRIRARGVAGPRRELRRGERTFYHRARLDGAASV